MLLLLFAAEEFFYNYKEYGNQEVRVKKTTCLSNRNLTGRPLQDLPPPADLQVVGTGISITGKQPSESEMKAEQLKQHKSPNGFGKSDFKVNL